MNLQRLCIYRTGESSWVRDMVSETLIHTGCIEGVDLRDWMVCRVFLPKEAHIDRFPHRKKQKKGVSKPASGNRGDSAKGPPEVQTLSNMYAPMVIWALRAHVRSYGYLGSKGTALNATGVSRT